MSSQILQFAALQRIFKPEGPLPRPSTVRRWADGQGIRYKYDGKGGIWTTVDAVNAALGLGKLPEEATKPEKLI